MPRPSSSQAVFPTEGVPAHMPMARSHTTAPHPPGALLAACLPAACNTRVITARQCWKDLASTYIHSCLHIPSRRTASGSLSPNSGGQAITCPVWAASGTFRQQGRGSLTLGPPLVGW